MMTHCFISAEILCRIEDKQTLAKKVIFVGAISGENSCSRLAV